MWEWDRLLWLWLLLAAVGLIMRLLQEHAVFEGRIRDRIATCLVLAGLALLTGPTLLILSMVWIVWDWWGPAQEEGL